MKKLTTAEFISRARKIHNDIYDYSLVDYIHSHSDVKINCSYHGTFFQPAHEHLRGKGCIECIHSTRRKTVDNFIKQCISVHGNNYDYSTVDYKRNKTPVDIICKSHGVFSQRPYSHLRGEGCPTCANNKIKTTLQFVEDAVKVHGSKYDYSLVNYKTHREKITIICKNHGEFYQAAGSHLSGKGCRLCASNRMVSMAIQQFFLMMIRMDIMEKLLANYINPLSLEKKYFVTMDITLYPFGKVILRK